MVSVIDRFAALAFIGFGAAHEVVPDGCRRGPLSPFFIDAHAAGVATAVVAPDVVRPGFVFKGPVHAQVQRLVRVGVVEPDVDAVGIQYDVPTPVALNAGIGVVENVGFVEKFRGINPEANGERVAALETAAVAVGRELCRGRGRRPYRSSPGRARARSNPGRRRGRGPGPGIRQR